MNNLDWSQFSTLDHLVALAMIACLVMLPLAMVAAAAYLADLLVRLCAKPSNPDNER
ncbi:hypothetical protein [Xanthomonas campestris]|uniref:hypothetical protein n=1 Tax=Xanthomonas campestris TaxID=339 RepID=UPI002379DBEE|nr:hypothetical protein [Xanthomonas campestris]WDK04529.1 hypothetical protein JH273_21675 [Xanthomonas campestris]